MKLTKVWDKVLKILSTGKDVVSMPTPLHDETPVGAGYYALRKTKCGSKLVKRDRSKTLPKKF